MSPRAAWRLERMGFPMVFDYEGGKMDWLSRGLPYEGAADLVSRHLVPAPTCQAAEPVSALRQQLGDGLQECLVVAGGLAVGFLDPQAADESSAEDAAVFGVTTVRPTEEVADLADRMEHGRVRRVVVTDAAGNVLGLYRRP